MKTLTPILVVLAVLMGLPAMAKAEKKVKPQTLDELVRRVKEGWREDSARIEKREAEFTANRDKQKAMLQKALKKKAAFEKRGADLELTFEENENRIAELEETLRSRLGTMGELFGVIRQVAGDTRGNIETSISSAQFPDRHKELATLAESKALPSIKQLEHLWYSLQQEAVESGKVVRFKTSVTDPDGTARDREVIRMGVFNAEAGGQYLEWLTDVQRLRVLPQQPPDRYLSTLEDLEKKTTGLVRVAIDPSRGQILSLLVQTPSIRERLEYGGIIGLLIMILGAIAFLIGLFRLLHLLIISSRVRRQEGNATPRTNNPLGRILKVFHDNRQLDTETLELKIDEAIVREQSGLERFLWAVKVVSVVAPLMGLLGTVTGMIRTFQAITLFGTGDPKMMASGISEALVTTMLGLIVAIPLVLLHSWVHSQVRRVMDVLAEQSTGIIAAQAEKEKQGGHAG